MRYAMRESFDLSILESSSKKVLAFIKSCEDADHLRALLGEEKEFENPRSTVIVAIEKKLSALADEPDLFEGGNDDDTGEDSDDLDDEDADSDDLDDEDADDEDADDLDDEDTGDEGADDEEPDENSDDDEGADSEPATDSADRTTGPAPLGRTSRAVFRVIARMADPAGEDPASFEGGNVPEPVFPEASAIAEQVGANAGQIRSILRVMRDRKLLTLCPPRDIEDRVYRYKLVPGARERVAQAEAIRAKRGNGGGPKSVEPVEPMATEDYIPRALKIGTIDRLIVRWSGTTHRERRQIDKDHGDGAHKTRSRWKVYTVTIDGKTVTGTAGDIVTALRNARNVLMADHSLRSAQSQEEDAYLTVINDGASAANEANAAK